MDSILLGVAQTQVHNGTKERNTPHGIKRYGSFSPDQICISMPLHCWTNCRHNLSVSYSILLHLTSTRPNISWWDTKERNTYQDIKWYSPMPSSLSLPLLCWTILQKEREHKSWHQRSSSLPRTSTLHHRCITMHMLKEPSKTQERTP